MRIALTILQILIIVIFVKKNILQNNKWFVVVNPEAGTGKGFRDWPIVNDMLERQGLKFDFAFTERKYHAVEITVWAIRNGFNRIAIVGGDGTLNEVLNGVFIQTERPPSEIILGVIGVGTGNDWQRSFALPHDYLGKVTALKEERTILQDVGRVEFFESRVKQIRYFANVAGVGFDAEVAKATNKLKEEGRRGRLLYLISILKALLVFKSSVAKVIIDNFSISGPVFSVILGMGKYSGGGMIPLPNAEPDNGLFEITVVKKISRLNLLLNIFRLYNGTILNHPKVFGYQSTTVKISANPPLNLEVDGESLGTSPFAFAIIPSGVRVVVGADFSTINNPTAKIYS